MKHRFHAGSLVVWTLALGLAPSARSAVITFTLDNSIGSDDVASLLNIAADDPAYTVDIFPTVNPPADGPSVLAGLLQTSDQGVGTNGQADDAEGPTRTGSSGTIDEGLRFIFDGPAPLRLLSLEFGAANTANNLGGGDFADIFVNDALIVDDFSGGVGPFVFDLSALVTEEFESTDTFDVRSESGDGFRLRVIRASTVPEPASALLLAPVVGLVLLLRARAR